jgi:hypothetical protein
MQKIPFTVFLMEEVIVSEHRVGVAAMAAEVRVGHTVGGAVLGNEV